MSSPALAAPAPAGRRHIFPRKIPRKLQVGLLVVGIAFAAVALAGQLIHRSASTNGTFAGVRSIQVDNGAGVVTVRTADRPDVAVAATRQWSFRGPHTRMGVHGGVLTLTGSCPGGIGAERCGVLWTVTAPPGIDITALSKNGDATVVGTTDAVRLHSDVGRMQVLDANGGSLDVSSNAGSVTVTARTAPSRVVAHTAAGDVQVSVPAGSYRVRATSGSGTTRVELPSDPAATRTIDASTEHGTVVVDRG